MAASASSSLLNADALPVIDLRVFTQSELRALSKSSASSVFESSSRFGGGEGDVPVPKIDRAVFNESAGSRKQTYSRMRLAPRKTEMTTGRIGEVGATMEKVEMDAVENWENRRIVGMLKELVGEESGEAEVFEGLVPVEVECDPELNFPDVELVRHPVQVEVGALSPVRRKRGRPRKDSDVNVNRIVLYDSEDFDEFGGEKLHVSKKKRDEDDMEMVNKNGVVVDLVALGNADDPFGPEMRRRTEGMSTKEQLLEFLSGLEGQWVSRRRKRKIIDASNFGDVLPRGWKLLFSIKKKSGHAWLICRRYISPSGRDFISCKEVSSYLQLLSGMQNEEKTVCIRDDEKIMPVEKTPIENVTLQVRNQVVQDDAMPHHHPTGSPIPNLATQAEHEGEITFSETAKNEISPHILPSSPKSKLKRRKLGTLVSDGVIIKDGKFECQFCHKIFEERRRYNGHVGVHVRSVEALRGSGIKPAGTDLGSVSVFHPIASGLDVTATFSSGALENHNDGTLDNAMDLKLLHSNLVGGSEIRDCTHKSNIEMSLVNVEVNQNIIDEDVFEKSNGKSDGQRKMADDVLGNSFSFGAEMNHSGALQTKFVENGLLEFCDGSRISMSDVKTVGEDGNSEKSTIVYNVAGKQFEGDEKSNGDSASFREKLILDVESIQHAVCADKTINSENNACGLDCNENEEQTINFTEQFGNERSSFSLGMVDNEQEDVCAFYQQRSTGSSLIASFLNEQRHSSMNSENEAAASRLMEYKEKFSEKDPPNLVSNKQALTVNNEFLDGISGSSSTPVCMHPSDSGIQPAVVSTSNHATLGGNDWSRDTPQKIFGVTYLFPSLNQNLGANNVVATSTDVNNKLPWKSPTFNPQLAVDNVGRASNSMVSKEFWKAVVVPSNNVEKIVNEAQMDMAVVSSLGHRKGTEGFSFSSLGNEQGFNIRNDMAGMDDNSMQGNRPERDYVSDFVNPFENGQSNRANPKMFSNGPMEQNRADEVRFPLNSELKISLGNDHSRLDAVNSNLKGQSLVLSGNQHFGLQNNNNAFYHSSVEEPRNQRARGSSLMDQFGQQELFGLQNNLNQAYNGSIWGEQRVGIFGPNHLMTGFDGGQPQRSENVLTDGNWNVGANVHGLTDSSLSRDQPSGYLHSLQMMPSKGDNQFFDAAQKFNNLGGFQDQRGGIQQREYNFLNAQAKPYNQETNVLPYEQSYDPASWLGRQAPFPQVPARNPPTASCVWCSNMFYHESLASFSQADTIVPTCPSCKAKMTEQLNLF